MIAGMGLSLCVILSHGMAMLVSKWAGVNQETWSLTDS